MSADHARKVQRLRVLSGRLNRMIEDGSFYDLPYLKRHGLIRRVKRLYGSLVGPVSPALLRTVLAGAATIVIGACAPAGGDTPKADNPSFAAPSETAFGLQQLPYGGTAPTFADIDGDGDADLFASGGGGGGESSGEIFFFENQGSQAAASFAPPAARGDLPSLGNTSLIPVLAPIDGDADFDAFVGQMRYDAQIEYYRNDSGTFSSQALPSGLALGGGPDYARSITFADIDGDADLDAFVSRMDSSYNSSIVYLRNDAGTFVDQATSLGLGVPSDYGPAFPTFVDIDADGDFDAFVGDIYGNIQFFRNTGTSTSPSFAAAEQNPFGLAPLSGPVVPAFVDIDADGDFDLFVGDNNGKVWFFENTNL